MFRFVTSHVTWLSGKLHTFIHPFHVLLRYIVYPFLQTVHKSTCIYLPCDLRVTIYCLCTMKAQLRCGRAMSQFRPNHTLYLLPSQASLLLGKCMKLPMLSSVKPKMALNPGMAGKHSLVLPNT